MTALQRKNGGRFLGRRSAVVAHGGPISSSNWPPPGASGLVIAAAMVGALLRSFARQPRMRLHHLARMGCAQGPAGPTDGEAGLKAPRNAAAPAHHHLFPRPACGAMIASRSSNCGVQPKACLARLASAITMAWSPGRRSPISTRT